jgi:recombinational DNA repair protein (RecF pathway)
MRGFIINIRKAKNEDVIVTVLSNQSAKSYWRFFGARHSILQIGNLIDFEVTESKRAFMPNMRSLSQLPFPWLFRPNHLLTWQNFIKLFEPHLRDASEIDSFYFNALLDIAQKWDKQNPKRLAVEMYIKLLKQEGRLYDNGFCHICEDVLEEEVGLMRAFIPAHPHCVYGSVFNKKDIFKLFNTASTIHLEDNVNEKIYNVLLKGL